MLLCAATLNHLKLNHVELRKRTYYRRVFVHRWSSGDAFQTCVLIDLRQVKEYLGYLLQQYGENFPTGSGVTVPNALVVQMAKIGYDEPIIADTFIYFYKLIILVFFP